ncbi:response regulator [Aureimonas leprariae]|uniref:Response regulator transcription factor n=1 Tax=Plantimonas leprariae TaxID=2615207 RepID=A0A7V7PPU4_9HYPH|nr:response regulator transcription factor [Aureimonas leprariae]KAB0680044.1 response regulator transcription factor [Aureimonas leprariae]
MSEVRRIVLADDHPLFRAGVALSLAETGRYDVVAQVPDADGAVASVREAEPDLALIDLSMPGSGLDAVRRIAESAPTVRVVVLTASESDDDVLAALAAGAKGYVLKGVGSENLVDVLDAVMRGESYVPPTLAARILSAMRRPAPQAVRDDPLARLTDREDEILRLVADGLSNKEVGLRLDLQEKTVKHHMTSILGKLNVRNRTEAAVLLKDRPRSG